MKLSAQAYFFEMVLFFRQSETEYTGFVLGKRNMVRIQCYML